MFDALKSLVLLKRLLTHLGSIDSSLSRLVDIHEQTFKLECIKAKITPSEVRSAEVVTEDAEFTSSGAGLLQQTDQEIKELDDTLKKFIQVVGREPAWTDSEEYIKKTAEKDPG